MFKGPGTAYQLRGFLAFLLWWAHILEADFCCIFLKYSFAQRFTFLLSHTLGQKAVGADTLGQKSTVTHIGYYYIAVAFYSYIGNQWSLECGRIIIVFSSGKCVN